MPASPNFAFLAPHDVQLVRLGALAERYFAEDPVTSLIKLRQFGEALAQLVAAHTGLYADAGETQFQLLQRLEEADMLADPTASLFHTIRVSGNRAAHSNLGTHADALVALRAAREVGVWFHRTFKDPSFSPGPFVPPPDPAAATRALQEELAALRDALDATRSEAQRAQAQAEAARIAHMTAEERAAREQTERELWEQLAIDADQARQALERQLAKLQAAAPTTMLERRQVISLAHQAAEKIQLSEADTRRIIDAQLHAAGWEADSQTMRYALGARPVKGHAMAIAEWPTASGPADYALFVDTRCVGVVEAKRLSRDVPAAIDQAQRYARGIQLAGEAEPAGGPWPDMSGAAYRVPFVFATNGRRYLKQLETASGIWFRDVRSATNHRRALDGWPTPQGLNAQVDMDAKAADAQLQGQQIHFAFPLRPYQQRAIVQVERHIAQGDRAMLLAMATGTGKTKLAIAMLYRLLSAKRFRRICFVVDRTALGEQTKNEFSSTRIVSASTFADIFGLKGIDEPVESDTKVHICTIQSLVRQVLGADDPKKVPPVDQYDLMVVDECHRGYLLDRELSDVELSFRSEEDYISKYRRVLEHFDAVKIGLTATPALHTVSIFGDPIFAYSYREAVVDGYLVDHEPPTQIITELAQQGITFAAASEVPMLDPATGDVDLVHMPDEVRFEVAEFNRRVVTRAFNRAVADVLTDYIDPKFPGKTLVFAVSNAHADIVVEELKRAFAEAYGEIPDAAVVKVTGVVDQVGKLIRAFRNDALPQIAVTVDLLTTGIDVPKIQNLVFLRRVNSRILYEQMLGRATRLCPEIDKQVFRIFDAVDLYRNLEQVSAMRPVVANPSIELGQLFEELASVPQPEQQEAVRDQLVVKLRRQLGQIGDEASAAYELATGETPKATLERLLQQPAAASAAWVQANREAVRLLDAPSYATGGGTRLPISSHPDRVVEVRQGYGSGQRPADYLDAFGDFVRQNANAIQALQIVTQRPSSLTRAALRELRLLLDAQGYGEATLRRAWYDAKNADIAASIIGFIRHVALGDPLIPYEQRVQAAMQRILASQTWTPVQRGWLKRIERQLIQEVVVDQESFEQEPFKTDGGFQRLDKVFGGKLNQVLADIQTQIWERTA